VKTIGLLTGGGDCPGLNAVIRAVVRRALGAGFRLLGIRRGWWGLIHDEMEELTLDSVSGILPRGGTILKTSRTNPFKREGDVDCLRATLTRRQIDALIAVGGEDTLGVAHRLSGLEIRVVGVPKTIDNDLAATDLTFGFDTAVAIATEAIDRLHSTAESHDRVLVVEVMGRHTGWIATCAGLAGGADYILIPEEPFSLEEVCRSIECRHARGKDFSIVVVAEGATSKDGRTIVQTAEVDEFGHSRLGGVGYEVGRAIERGTGFETRVIVLGHLQRGGSPTAYDRILATRFGVAAVDLVINGQFGQMVGLRGNEIVPVPLGEAVARLKPVDPALYDTARLFFG
jgi:6-phosphofructokinase 1